MQFSHLEYLCCPNCKGKLNVISHEIKENEVFEGILECSCCKEKFPILDFIPIMLPQVNLPDYIHNPGHLAVIRKLGFQNRGGNFGPEDLIKMRSSFQWGVQRESDSFTSDQANDTNCFSREFFFEETQLREEIFRNKLVLDACCGGGRGLVHSILLGKQVIGLDLSETIFQVRNNIPESHREKLFLVRGDVTRVPFRNETFDVIYSQRALHHLPSFEDGLKELKRTLKPEGFLGFSVYSDENNQIMKFFVEPFRSFIFEKFGLSGIRIASEIIAFAVFPVLKGYFKAFRKKESTFLFHQLFLHWGSMRFKRFCTNIVFDLLHAPKARYLSKIELENILRLNEIVPNSFFHQHKTVWCVSGKNQKK